MARIRTIKPEFWSSEQVVACSLAARLLFIGLWNFADDNGVHPASLLRLRMEVFPGDDLHGDEFAHLVDELRTTGLVRQYEAKGQQWWHVTGWEHHQHINRPTPSRYPPPPAIHGGLSDDSRNTHAGKEGKGRERKGKEGKGKEKAHVPCDPAADLASCRADATDLDLASHATQADLATGKRNATRANDEPAAHADLLDETQCPPELATPAVRDAIREFNEFRREKRWGAMSARSWSKVWKSFTGYRPSDFIAAVDASIAAGWRGIFPPKGAFNGNRTRIANGPAQTHAADRVGVIGEL